MDLSLVALWLANNQTSVTVTTRQLDMVTKTKNQKFPNSIQLSILVGFSKNLSYSTHVLYLVIERTVLSIFGSYLVTI